MRLPPKICAREKLFQKHITIEWQAAATQNRTLSSRITTRFPNTCQSMPFYAQYPTIIQQSQIASRFYRNNAVPKHLLKNRTPYTATQDLSINFIIHPWLSIRCLAAATQNWCTPRLLDPGVSYIMALLSFEQQIPSMKLTSEK